MTANVNINYRSPIPLGSTVLLTCSLDKKEGQKTFVSCQVTNTDGSKLHTEATGLFLSITMGHRRMMDRPAHRPTRRYKHTTSETALTA
uniref:Acyl-coenzyme A thioesterase THEM4 n=1 Tax=Hucho hucho TaxID=62062 RepID=A0A4W5RKN6_9TELE